MQYGTEHWEAEFSLKELLIYRKIYESREAVVLDDIEMELKKEYLKIKFPAAEIRLSLEEEKTRGDFSPNTMQKVISKINIENLSGMPETCRYFLMINQQHKKYFLKLGYKFRG